MNNHVSRRGLLKGGLMVGATALMPAMPSIARANTGSIKVGMTSTFSGRVAQMGISARNAVDMLVEEFNTAGGLDGRPIQLVVRDSKGRPEEAARLTRELVESEGCQIMLSAEASGASFAAHEVMRNTDVLCLHLLSETTQLTADPALRSPNTFRTARQALHDSIVGGAFAANIAKNNGLKRWATIAADYAYGREATPEFMNFLKAGGAEVELVAEAWPKLFQPDYTADITRILQAQPEALFCGLWGGDLVSFIDQGNLFGLFDKVQVFSIHMADYTTLTVVSKLPEGGLYSSNRYVTAFPDTAENRAWSDAYSGRFGSRPTNWSWESDAGVRFLTQAMKSTGSSDPKMLAEAIRGSAVASPIGVGQGGTVQIRESDHTIIDYAFGWGRIVPQEPYLVDIQAADWTEILEREATWMKDKGYL